MREIKFRGKTPKDIRGNAPEDTWLYGDLDTISDPSPRIRILEGNDIYNIAIRPATVGQFTGLIDKNGKEIYEGDIVKYDGGDWWYKVVFLNAAFKLNRPDGYFFTIEIDDVFEVIGNIHDNPELKKITL